MCNNFIRQALKNDANYNYIAGDTKAYRFFNDSPIT
jgi:hypothetical protein